jgi:amino acid permease
LEGISVLIALFVGALIAGTIISLSARLFPRNADLFRCWGARVLIFAVVVIGLALPGMV